MARFWYTAIVIAFLVAGIGIVASVAYYLYGQPSSFENTSTAHEDRTATFVCSDGTTIVALFERDEVFLTFSNGRMASAVFRSPAVIGESPGTQYVSLDGSLTFWRADGDTLALVEEQGAFVHGECVPLEP